MRVPWQKPHSPKGGTAWQCVEVIDAHTAGEPLRIVTAGYPEPPGSTMLEKRRYAKENLDALRRLMMLEPRGHADMYGCVLTEPVTDDGDVGVLFLHNEGYSTMCGHGIIALTRVALECELIEPRPERLFPSAEGDEVELRIDSPAGRIIARAQRDARGVVTSTTFRNVPSFVEREGFEVEVPGLGDVACTIAFGGAFYAYVDAADVGLELVPERSAEIIDLGRRIKLAVAERVDLAVPESDPVPGSVISEIDREELGFLYGTIFVAPSETAGVHSRNVCVFADGELDRSPTGTGVSARAAIHHARGELVTGEWITIESVLGTRFDVRVVETAELAGVSAVVPEVRGQAHFSGRSVLVLDPDDPLPDGFLLR